MAKILTQISYFDYSEIEILGDLERLQLAFEGMDDETLMRKLEKKRGQGRNDYPIRVMWNLVIAMKVFGHRTVESFRRELSRNAQLRKICGLRSFNNKRHLAPPARVFSNFLNLLATEQDEVDRIFASEVAALYEAAAEFGKALAGDGKYVDSYAKRPCKDCNPKAGRRAESDAAFSVKEYHYTGSDGKKHVKKETHYGFKVNLICDVGTELPLAYSVKAANCNEKEEMGALLAKLTDKQKAAAETLALDRGYDSAAMIRQIKGIGICPVVDIRNCWKDGEGTKQYKNTDMVYNYKGEVFFVDARGNQHKMRYRGHDCTKKCLRYEYGGKLQKIYVSYDERVFLPVARDSMKFKRLYRGRTAVERLNGRIDRDFMFEDHCNRGLKKTRLLVSLSLIVMNAMAAGKIQRGIAHGLAAHTKIGLPKTA
jgi:hypothetical protein